VTNGCQFFLVVDASAAHAGFFSLEYWDAVVQHLFMGLDALCTIVRKFEVDFELDIRYHEKLPGRKYSVGSYHVGRL
jgi:hypothetical protein